jgi:FkbM family methyltransferase
MTIFDRWFAKSAPPPSRPAPSGNELTRDHVIWAYRLLLDREPENEFVVESKLRGLSDTRQLRNAIVASPEFEEKNRDFAHTNERNLVIKELDDGVRLVVDLADHVIGLNIIRGRFERNELAFARSIVRPGHHALDCGAHIGLFAMHMAAWAGPSGSVHAFEPFEPNAECLARSIEENRFAERVVLERAAVGAASGTSQLVFATHSLNTGGGFIHRAGTELPPYHETRTVTLVALDAYPLRRPVSFIKIDVEGAEPLAMRGAERLLREDRPVILSEIHPYQLRAVSNTTADEYLAQMRGLGYVCRALGGNGVPSDELRAVPDGDVTTVVFLPSTARTPARSET